MVVRYNFTMFTILIFEGEVCRIDMADFVKIFFATFVSEREVWIGNTTGFLRNSSQKTLN